MTSLVVSSPVYPTDRVSDLLCIGPVGNPPESLEGFITFFDPGWSILELKKRVADRGKIFFSQNWYEGASFALRSDQPAYRQLRMQAVSDSFSKTFNEQQALLGSDEAVPSTRIVVMGMVVHFLATGERLFPDCYVRTADVDADGFRGCVGSFDADGLYVFSCRVGNRGGIIGLSSLRKF